MIVTKLRVFYAAYALLIIWAIIKAKPTDAEIEQDYARRLEDLVDVDYSFDIDLNMN